MKLLASDLDGTLFFKHLEKGYKESDIEAIKQFQKDGNLFGCCTGRALLGATPSFENLLQCDFYIASSGAMVCDKDLNVIYESPIDFKIAKSIVDKYKDIVTIFIQSKRYYILKKGYPEEIFKYVESFDELKDEKIYSICLITEDQHQLDIMETELKQYSNIAGYRNMDAIDIVNGDCSKGKAVQIVKDYFKANQSYGIGDSYNDIPLLQEADYSFTFNNSPEAVKQEADLLVDSIEEAIGKITKKLFASDLDGTLFFKGGHKEGDFKAIKKFQEAGHLFGCCTGRTLEGALRSFDNFYDLDFYIASSGAVICNAKKEVIYEAKVDFEIVKEIYETYKGQVNIVFQGRDYYSFRENEEGINFTHIYDLEAIRNEPLYGLCLFTEEYSILDQIEVELKEKYPQVSGHRNLGAIDVVSCECSKGIALKKVKELFNADITYGIGDAKNDLPMIRQADVGFTFHSSLDEVKNEADQVVDSVEEAIYSVM